jgi:phosphoenolpyruvate carboxykinase (ATP)
MESVNWVSKVNELLNSHQKVHTDPPRAELIESAVRKKNCLVSPSGALVTWCAVDSTGRNPKDTYIVDNPASSHNIDWTSPDNNPMKPEVFDELLAEALEKLEKKEELFVTNRVIGADSAYALPIKTVTYYPLTSVFTDNMFRAVPEDIANSHFANDQFTLVVLPYDRVNTEKYLGKLRQVGNSVADLVIAMDVDRKIGLVYGSEYSGSTKKLVFSLLNYLLPEIGVLPLHCSANESMEGKTAIFLGLSGTGKTTLSTDPSRKLIGDDEHGWSDNGIYNFENGCYAKLIDLNPEKEPEIYHATFDERPYLENGCIIENALMYPDGRFDLSDQRLTENSRTSYPLRFLENIKSDSKGTHPEVIVFLTADAYGVLPPVAKLTPEQAMLWFLMGYTSKLAGTERGVTEPQSTFSRFFGEPFMPRNPSDYTTLLKEKIEKHNSRVYLLNTGWSGGAYGVGKRMDIKITRKMLNAILSGQLEQSAFKADPIFKVFVPEECEGVESTLLTPKNTWEDHSAYEQMAQKLAGEFAKHFEKAFGAANLSPEVKAACPGV